MNEKNIPRMHDGEVVDAELDRMVAVETEIYERLGIEFNELYLADLSLAWENTRKRIHNIAAHSSFTEEDHRREFQALLGELKEYQKKFLQQQNNDHRLSDERHLADVLSDNAATLINEVSNFLIEGLRRGYNT